jgi:reverse gyrase
MFFRLANCGVDLAQQQVKMLINVLESRMARRLDGMGASKAIRPAHPFKVFSTGAVIREHTLSISEDSSGILTSPSKRLKVIFWICQTTG